MQSHIVVAAVDEAEFRRMNLDFPPVLCDATGQMPGADGDQPPQLSDLLLNALCVLATSPDGLQSAEAFCARFSDELGAEPPMLVDLSATLPEQRRADALTRIVQALLLERDTAARRQVELLRDLAHLRAEHETLHRAFSLLEGFVAEADLNHRQLTRDLAPAAHTQPISLTSGDRLRQRLPRRSSGICDVAVHIARVPSDPAGQLHAALRTGGTDEQLAQWTLTGAELAPGWLRLPLDIALAPDDRTLDLVLDWTGTGALDLDWSLRHPDPRYCLQLADAMQEDRVLALRLWTYIPGCAAPLPGDGLGAGDAAAQALPREALASAVNLNPGNTDTKFLDQAGVLQVHPVQGDLAAALLPGAVRPGVSQVTADIRSLSDQAPEIEFAIAIAPASARIDPAAPGRGLMRRRGALRPLLEAMSADPDSRQSEWYRLKPTQSGHVDLLLPTPAHGAMDLYLMTRMADATARPSWAWAAFSGVTLRRGRG